MRGMAEGEAIVAYREGVCVCPEDLVTVTCAEISVEGFAGTSGQYYNSWQRLNYATQSTPPNTTVSLEAHSPPSQLANKEISNSYWKNPKITLKHQISVLEYRTGTIYTSKHAFRFKMTSTSACCPLCGKMGSINHIPLRCLKPTMNGMHTNRHHVGLSFYVKALSKGRYGSSLVSMDACRNERLLEQDIKVPENISRAIPDWVFPNGTDSSAQNQSRPDAVFVRSITGQPSHIDLNKIPPQDREIHLVIITDDI
eukprot:1138844-Pelagomonas_calceolata.AAC.2